MRERAFRRVGFLAIVASGLVLLVLGVNGVAGVDGRLDAATHERGTPVNYTEGSRVDGRCRDREKREERAPAPESSL
jgi:hypothetical protein